MLTHVIAALAVTTVVAQDPAPGWLGYAMARAYQSNTESLQPSAANLPAPLPATLPPVPPTQGARLTYISAKWKVLSNPRNSQSFYSPWFGIDTTDNLK